MLEKIVKWINDHLLLGLFLTIVFRVVFLAVNGLDLIGDESYYWEWSRHPDWCYYSKPPMVAWLIGISTSFFGDTSFFVRLPTIILGAFFLIYFYLTTHAIFGRRTAALAVLMISVTPISLVANFIMTIDPPLYCFWMATIYYLRKAIFEESTRAWLLAGIACALALLSKQVAVALPLLTFLFIISSPTRHRWLKREYWIFLLPVLVITVPILSWNIQHDWVMFEHSKGHFESGDPIAWSQKLMQAANFILYQALLITPIFFGLIVWMSLKLAVAYTKLPSQQQFLWLMGPLMILLIIGLGFFQKVQGNWSMPFYFTAFILLVGQWKQRYWRKLIRVGAYIGVVMVLITTFLPSLIQLTSFKGTPLDPTRRFKNWEAIAGPIHQKRLELETDLAQTFVIAFGHRTIASQLAFYLPDHPKVYRVEPSGQVMTQYELWDGPFDFIDKNAYVVAEVEEDKLPAGLRESFSSFKKIADVSNPNKPGRFFYIFRGEKLLSWPFNVSK